MTIDAVRNLYFDIMKRTLLDWIYDRKHRGDICGLSLIEGDLWPDRAHTMIGLKRLNNIQACMESILQNGVPGDVIEAGVWRGGACIFMRAILKAYNSPRRVWVADSFQGFPSPDPEFPQDKNDPFSHCPELAVSLEQVKANFESYNLLDDQVVFLKGFFKDTFPILYSRNSESYIFSLIRLDGDTYEATALSLQCLYPLLAPQGFCIIDDYSLPACMGAVRDFRRQHDISDPIIHIDRYGVFWQKGSK